MTNRLLELETELFELARAFAAQVVREAFHARVDELSDVAQEAARSPHAPTRLTLPAMRQDAAVGPGIRSRRAERETTEAGESRSDAPPPKRRGRPPGKRRAPRFDPAPTEDGDAMDNVITDPSLLLGVIGAEMASSARGARFAREPMPGLLGPSWSTSAAPSTAPSTATSAAPPYAQRARASAEQGPSLRPGERVQRTAGGSVVLLRRGRK